MAKFIDVEVLKQQDFQDYSKTDVEYAIDHCPIADVIETETAVSVAAQIVMEAISEYRKINGEDPVFYLSTKSLQRIANYMLEVLGKAPWFEE
jgi:hypothetical protein